MNKIAYYTAIFGDYDDLITPVHYEKLRVEADFYCFTDNPGLRSDCFKVVLVERPHSDPVKSNRYYKILSHKFLSEYEIVIYADANVRITCSSFLGVVAENLSKCNLAVFKHSERDCLYKEADWVLSRTDIDKASVVKTQIERYRREGFPVNYGLSACTYLLRRHSVREVQNFDEKWWEEVQAGSRRDQLSFDYVRWRLGTNVGWIPGHWMKNSIGDRLEHKVKRVRATKKSFTLQRVIKSLVPLRVKRAAAAALKEMRRKADTFEKGELLRLKKLPNNIEFDTVLLGPSFKANSRGPFMFLYKEIFLDGVYDFQPVSTKPFIIDCGVNIGLSVVYFKKRFPTSVILGFEPDLKLYELAMANVRSFELTEVELLNCGVWSSSGYVDFFDEGNDGGRIAALDVISGDIKKVQVVQLSSYIDRPVDFLKIDIEGAELDVISECASKLHLVNQLFIEYHSFANRPQELSRLLDIIRQAGFRYSISSPKVLNKAPFKSTTDYLGIDLLLNICAYRPVDKSNTR